MRRALFAALTGILLAAPGAAETLLVGNKGEDTLSVIALDSGAQVELGRGTDDEVVARTERFAATLPQVTGRFQRPLEYADLRHQDGYAVRLTGITTVNPEEQKKQGR